MRAQRERDTAIERDLMKGLWSRGLRYRKHVRVLPRREADIVFLSAKLAIFVDGCFWHGCEQHGSMPKSNSQWWSDKISENRRRDLDTDSRLTDLGWVVLRIWEHESTATAVERVARTLESIYAESEKFRHLCHGTVSTYLRWGCRCEACKDAHLEAKTRVFDQ